MQQSKNGERVLNRHRPFSKNQFSQRYLRLVEAPLQEELDTRTTSSHDCDEQYCDCLRCYQDDHPYVSKPDYARQEIRNRLHGQAHAPLHALIAEDLKAKLLSQCPEAPKPQPQLREERLHPEDLPFHLAQYATYFDHQYQTQYPLPDLLLDFLEDDATTRQIREINDELMLWSQDFLIDFLILQPFWVRDIHTWNDPHTTFPDRFRSLIDHLFVIYPVPEFLYRGWKPRPTEPRAAWQHERLNPNTTWIQWFLLLAQGASLHDAAPLLGWEITRKFTHYLHQVPAELEFADALLWVEMQQLRLSRLDFEQIRALQCFAFKAVVPAWEAAQVEFSRQTLLWLDRHCDAYTAVQWEIVLDFAMHMVTEVERNHMADFRWQGRSAARVLALSQAHLESRYLPYSRMSWARKDWDMTIASAEGDVWTFTELCSGRELYLEGIAMRHCVGGYAEYCARGHCSIFSICLNGQRKLTIEILMATKTITQAKGRCNRNASKEEMAVVREWMVTKVAPSPSK